MFDDSRQWMLSVESKCNAEFGTYVVRSFFETMIISQLKWRRAGIDTWTYMKVQRHENRWSWFVHSRNYVSTSVITLIGWFPTQNQYLSIDFLSLFEFLERLTLSLKIARPHFCPYFFVLNIVSLFRSPHFFFKISLSYHANCLHD